MPDSRVRLSLDTLDRRGHHPEIVGPAHDPRGLDVGIVHLGLGAFHRAHQAVFTEDALAATGDTGWGILGVTQRSARVVEQLRPQDGLYGVLSKGEHSTSLRVVGSLREVAFPGDETDAVLARIAAPSTRIVSLTVTEKGYHRTAAGSPDLADPDVASDVAALRAELEGTASGSATPSRTPIGLLVRGIALRRARHEAPLTVVCCDNMVDNGPTVRALVLATAAAAGPRGESLAAWIDGAVRFPATMVDRIVPATTPAHRAEAAALLGLDDEGLVVGEPFSQWVVQDDFAGPRPRWELAGATLTGDVEPYERTKLRMLNGTHSTLAYLGQLRGHRTIAEAVADPEIEALARALVDEDVIPTLSAPDGLDLAAYRESVLERFANPNTGHTTLQVAMDGSQKLPIRLLGTVADRLAAGVVPQAAARALAAWAVFVGQAADGPAPLDDPLADVLRAAASGAPDGLADRLLDLGQIFPAEVAGSEAFRAEVRAGVRELRRGLVPTS
ncbi:mannitol dehydrogenase family protein [Cellulomonas cellasea]|uniref:mannitol dehydrogenase family protein n=1 Tax=Cellulomonas cellasea TaxID=43670 RepID=UPI0025A46BCF|nr:mannitol dehydrogenase family protein [Cellulomonas cellasea]MDM8084823.1 mannitol dehydrogenase family protein [Cellulomonas cellasea]